MDEYFYRRKRLLNKMKPNSVAILVGANLKYRNADVEFPFRQESDVYYLSGISNPDIVLVLEKDENGDGNYFVFFIKQSKLCQIWHGEGLDEEKLTNIYGVDKAYKIQYLDKKMKNILQKRKNIYYKSTIKKHFLKENIFFSKVAVIDQIKKWLDFNERMYRKSRKQKDYKYYDLKKILHEMRLIKSKEEIKNIAKAAKFTADAHNKLMKICKPGLYEFQLAAKFNYIFQKKGIQNLAYQTIVGGGENACVLHYVKNNSQLKKKDLVLIDAGCEYNYYAADVTRTYPVNGKFSFRQKQLYQLVLEAQKKGISLIKPGSDWGVVEKEVKKVIFYGLIDLGILKCKKAGVFRSKKASNFYMHSCGHWLGLDVHDVGNKRFGKKYVKFRPNMVLTIEPGIYLSRKNEHVPEKWRGIGIRIEDNILITKEGNKNLTSKAIKEVSDIENFMR